MLYMTKLKFDWQDSSTRELFKDRYKLHQRVMSLFGNNDHALDSQRRAGVLYAVSRHDGNLCVVVQSTTVPVNDENTGIVTDYPLKLAKVGHLAFQADVNPTMVNGNKKKIGIAADDEKNIRGWVDKMMIKKGLKVHQLSVFDRAPVIGFKEKDRIVRHRVQITGTVDVFDEKLFIETYENPLGEGRSFGLGMLQLIGVNRDEPPPSS